MVLLFFFAFFSPLCVCVVSTGTKRTPGHERRKGAHKNNFSEPHSVLSAASSTVSTVTLRSRVRGGGAKEADLCFNRQGDTCGVCPSLNPDAGDDAALRGEPGIKGEPGLPGTGEQGLPVSAAHIPR